MKTQWDLSLLYTGPTDPLLERDIVHVEKKAHAFEKKFKGKAFTASPELLASAYKEYEVLHLLLSERKPWMYFALASDVDSDNTYFTAQAAIYEERFNKAENHITFFSLEIAKIPIKHQKLFLNHPSLTPYRYSLERIFATAKYLLPEGEEQVINLLAASSYTSWVEGNKKLLQQQTVTYKGKIIPITQAVALLNAEPKKKRDLLQKKITNVFKSISHFAEAELNAVVQYKKIIDERRGYVYPYSETVHTYENDEKTIENLIATVTKHFYIAHRFFKIHAQLLGQNILSYSDRGAPIGAVKKTFDFKTAYSLVYDSLAHLNPLYGSILADYVAKGQVDVFSKKGKTGGAYCWGVGNLPTFVLLNHVNDIRSVETFAHEMGHAIHTELSKNQPPLYQRYSTATAEVASTFFEQVVTLEIEKTISDKEKIILLHSRLLNDVATIFRQVACFNFENELHDRIRKEGYVSKEVIASLLQKHMQAYMGPSAIVTQDDGYTFVYWSHIRSFFYVYSYAYGQLISRSLFERWKTDTAYAAKIHSFLSAGRSMSPEKIFKSIGLNTKDPTFFEAGLKGIEQDIKTLEQLVKKNMV